MEFPISCVLTLSFLVSSVLGFPPLAGYYFHSETDSRLCPTSSKPCKILVKKYSNSNEGDRVYTSPDICNCPTGTCPEEWNQAPDNTITRYLQSKDRLLSLQMKFCNPVAPQRTCGENESALVVKGHSLVPSEIVEFNCRCPGNRRMILSKTWFQGFRDRYQEYVCSLPLCPSPDSQCMSVSTQPPRVRETVFQCDCGRGRVCKGTNSNDQRRANGEESKGFCTSNYH